jgi:hypothetical protein
MISAVEQRIEETGGCHGCPDRPHKIWVITFDSCFTLRLCRVCLAALKAATR